MDSQNNKLIMLFVTCSLTSGREAVSVKVTESILKHYKDIADFATLINLDNGSIFSKHSTILPSTVPQITFNKNIGYWQALYWFLNKGISELKLEQYEYIYIIESDNFHTSLLELREIVKMMGNEKNIISTRTQEFSVKYRWLFSKKNRLNPLRIRRSLISLKNLVTHEKAQFNKISGYKNLYVTNLHAKLPAVHRVKSLVNVFSKLQQMDNFTEHDFFKFIQLDNQKNALLDKGIYHTLANYKNAKTVESGSWVGKFKGDSSGYLPTRFASIKHITDPVYNNYKII